MERDMHAAAHDNKINDILNKLATKKQTIALAMDFMPHLTFQIDYQISSFAGIVIAPTDDAKNAMFDVPYPLLNANGSHSETVATWIAKQTCDQFRTTYGCAIIKSAVQHTFWIAMCSSNGEERSIPLPFYRKQNADEHAIQTAFQLIDKM